MSDEMREAFNKMFDCISDEDEYGYQHLWQSFAAGWQAALESHRVTATNEVLDLMADEIRCEIMRNRFPGENSKYKDAAIHALRVLTKVTVKDSFTVHQQPITGEQK